MKVLWLGNFKTPIYRVPLINDFVERAVIVSALSGKEPDRTDAHGNCVIYNLYFRSPLAKYVKLILTGYRFFRKDRFDLIAVSDPFSCFFAGIILSRLFKVPINVAVHDSVFSSHYESLGYRFKMPFVKFLLGQAHSIKVVSNTQKKIFIDLGLDERRIFYCPSNYDMRYFLDRKENASAPAYPEYEYNLLFVGRLSPEKDLETLLKSVALVRVEMPAVLLLIIGNGPKREEYQRLAMSLGIASNVKFLGEMPREHLPAYYDVCDIYVLSSLRESLGKVIIEAAVCRKPVVTTRTTGARELIEDGRNGFVVDVRDQRTFADRIMRLLRDPALRERMGHANYEHVRSLGYFDSRDNRLKVRDMWQKTIADYVKKR